MCKQISRKPPLNPHRPAERLLPVPPEQADIVAEKQQGLVLPPDAGEHGPAVTLSQLLYRQICGQDGPPVVQLTIR